MPDRTETVALENATSTLNLMAVTLTPTAIKLSVRKRGVGIL